MSPRAPLRGERLRAAVEAHRQRARAAGPFLVELSGLPGAGKTTLARHWLRALEARGARVRAVPGVPPAPEGRVARALELTRLVAAHPYLGLRLAQVSGLGRPALGLTAALLRRARLVDACRALDADLAIFDEALLQGLWSVVAERRPVGASQAAPLVPALLGTHRYALVHVQATPRLAADRLAARGTRHSRFDGLPPAEAAPRLGTGPALFEALHGATDVPFLQLPAESPPETALPDLLRLAVHLGGRLDGLTVVTTTRMDGP